jgi:hypothetical protein
VNPFEQSTGKQGIFTLSHRANQHLGQKLLRVHAIIADTTPTHVILKGHLDISKNTLVGILIDKTPSICLGVKLSPPSTPALGTSG